MKSGFCERCPKLDHCTLRYNKNKGEMEPSCPKMRAELNRIEKPRRKGRVELVYESDMTGESRIKFENCLWGSVKIKEE